MATLPYVTTPGNIEKALKGIKAAATPPSASQDFIKNIIGIKGGPGNEIASYLKKIGFVSTDGTPASLYNKFRNPATEGWAAAEALKIGYAALYTRNEYMHTLTDEDLKGLILEETGAGQDSRVVQLVFACIKQLKKFAKHNVVPPGSEKPEESPKEKPLLPPSGYPTLPPPSAQHLGLNLAYTINLNLPATSDPAVFNAIFRALKEHLIRESHE